MKKAGLILILVALVVTGYAYELRKLADAPTAGVLQRGEASVFTKIYRQSGMLVGAEVGLFPGFMFGVSYGGENIVGNDEPVWHERIEFMAKYRLIDESAKWPAVAIGYDSRGHGVYHKYDKRYDIKSKGFYAVASKNYLLLGNLGFHGGINYSMENEDDDDDINFFVGIDKDITSKVTVACEYDLALNDTEGRKLDPEEDVIEEQPEDDEIPRLENYKKGYLNAAINIRFTDYLMLRVEGYDILENSKLTNGFDRAVMIIYNMTF